MSLYIFNFQSDVESFIVGLLVVKLIIKMFLEHNHMAGIYYIPVHCRQYQVRDQVSVVCYKEMASLHCVHRVNAFDGQVVFYFSKI